MVGNDRSQPFGRSVDENEADLATNLHARGLNDTGFERSKFSHNDEATLAHGCGLEPRRRHTST